MKGTQDLDHAPIQYDFHSHSNKEHYLERVGSQELLLRTLSCSMKEKRLLRQLRASTEKDVPKLVALKQSLYRAEKKLQEGIWNLVRIWRLWKVPLDKIGGNFGPGIQSYFSFLRFLLFINFLAVLLTTTFILLPVTMYNNVTIFLEAWSTEPQCVNHTIANSFRSPWQRFQDIFTGEGSLEHSYLFYGAYRVKQDSNHHYNVPLAYLLSMLGFLFACLIWILQRIVARLVQWQMQQWEFKPSFSARIFTEWDFCIQNPETANLKQKNIYNDLKIDLAEQIRLLQNEQRTRKQLAQQYLLRMLINIVILSLMAVAFYCIHKATDFSQEQNQ